MRRKVLLRGLLALAALAVLDQLLRFGPLADGEFLGRRIAPFDPPLFTDAQRAALARLREHVERGTPLAGAGFDADLGWGPPAGGGEGEFRFDAAGARIARAPTARAKDPARRRIVCVGDSFTLGAEVGALETWAAELEELRPDLEPVNLGFSGYGADQAFLRLERDGLPLAPDEVWFGITPFNAPRCVTTYLPAWRHWGPMLAVKPRFALDAQGGLRRLPPPARTARGLVALLDEPGGLARAARDSDRWIGRHPWAYAAEGSVAVHASGLARLALTALEKGGRDPTPELADPGSELARLLTGIVVAARTASTARGAAFRLLVFPDRRSLAERARGGDDGAAVLVAGLRARGVESIDCTAHLLELRAHEDDVFWAPEGHYSARGNGVVAAFLAVQARR